MDSGFGRGQVPGMHLAAVAWRAGGPMRLAWRSAGDPTTVRHRLASKTVPGGKGVGLHRPQPVLTGLGTAENEKPSRREMAFWEILVAWGGIEPPTRGFSIFRKSAYPAPTCVDCTLQITLTLHAAKPGVSLCLFTFVDHA